MYITATREDRKYLLDKYNLSSVGLWKILNFISNSELAHKIRSEQISRGGVLMGSIDSMTTMFDADGYIRQYFPNGALIEIKKNTDIAYVYFQGRKIDECKVTFENIGHLQKRVSSFT